MLLLLLLRRLRRYSRTTRNRTEPNSQTAPAMAANWDKNTRVSGHVGTLATHACSGFARMSLVHVTCCTTIIAGSTQRRHPEEGNNEARSRTSGDRAAPRRAMETLRIHDKTVVLQSIQILVTTIYPKGLLAHIPSNVSTKGGYSSNRPRASY